MLPEYACVEPPAEHSAQAKPLEKARAAPRLQAQILPFGRSTQNHYMRDLFSLEGEKCSSVL